MELTDTVALSEDVVAREVAGETVLLNLASGTYFGLNDVGGRIWQWLDDNEGCSLGEISTRLQSEYAIPAEDAQRDVLALAGDLAEHGLLEHKAA